MVSPSPLPPPILEAEAVAARGGVAGAREKDVALHQEVLAIHTPLAPGKVEGWVLLRLCLLWKFGNVC